MTTALPDIEEFIERNITENARGDVRAAHLRQSMLMLTDYLASAEAQRKLAGAKNLIEMPGPAWNNAIGRDGDYATLAGKVRLKVDGFWREDTEKTLAQAAIDVFGVAPAYARIGLGVGHFANLNADIREDEIGPWGVNGETVADIGPATQRAIDAGLREATFDRDDVNFPHGFVSSEVRFPDNCGVRPDANSFDYPLEDRFDLYCRGYPSITPRFANQGRMWHHPSAGGLTNRGPNAPINIHNAWFRGRGLLDDCTAVSFSNMRGGGIYGCFWSGWKKGWWNYAHLKGGSDSFRTERNFSMRIPFTIPMGVAIYDPADIIKFANDIWGHIDGPTDVGGQPNDYKSRDDVLVECVGIGIMFEGHGPPVQAGDGVADNPHVSAPFCSNSAGRHMNRRTIAAINGNTITLATPFNSLVTGTASAGAASSLIDASKAWTVNQYRNHQLRITAGTGSGQTRFIASNTATGLVTTAAWTTPPDATSQYSIDAIPYLPSMAQTGAFVDQIAWVALASGKRQARYITAHANGHDITLSSAIAGAQVGDPIDISFCSPQMKAKFLFGEEVGVAVYWNSGQRGYFEHVRCERIRPVVIGPNASKYAIFDMLYNIVQEGRGGIVQRLLESDPSWFFPMWGTSAQPGISEHIGANLFTQSICMGRFDAVNFGECAIYRPFINRTGGTLVSGNIFRVATNFVDAEVPVAYTNGTSGHVAHCVVYGAGGEEYANNEPVPGVMIGANKVLVDGTGAAGDMIMSRNALYSGVAVTQASLAASHMHKPVAKLWSNKTTTPEALVMAACSMFF